MFRPAPLRSDWSCRPEPRYVARDAPGSVLYRVDAGYVEHQVGIEYDGEEFHFRTLAQLRADEVRRDDLRRRYTRTVVGATSENVLAARPAVEQVAAELIGWTRPLLRRAWGPMSPKCMITMRGGGMGRAARGPVRWGGPRP
jgi:hypothetical protein